MDDKFIILVGDGMGDYPIEQLGGLTPLEAARTPNLDMLVPLGRLGTVRTVPHGMEPGSDVANMSLLGYDPSIYHTGRGPLEAASIGVKLEKDDLAFRCNLVHLGMDEAGRSVMDDYSAGHISTPEAHEIIASLQEAVSGTPLRLYPGVSYRNLLVWKGGPDGLETTPPHNILGRAIKGFDTIFAQPVIHSLVSKASGLLEDHPVNRERRDAGKKTANSLWPWGQGKAPSLPKLTQFGISGAMISAVDLLKGIGVYAGLEPIDVPGATGYLDTNYEGKVSAALTALTTMNFVFLHLEAPDEASHSGILERKIEAIENFDQKIVGPIIEGISKYRRSRVLIATDHYTPVATRDHSADPAPFLLIDDLHAGRRSNGKAGRYCERDAQAAGWRLDSGVELFRAFMERGAGKSF